MKSRGIANNRRHFIKAGVTGLAALGLKPLRLFGFENRNEISTTFLKNSYTKLKMCTRYELLPGESVLSRFNNAAEYGFDGISLPGRFLDTYIQELKTVKNDLPLPIVSISLGFQGSLVSPVKKLRTICRQSLINLFDLCSELKIMCVNMPPVLKMDNPKRYNNEELQDELLISQLYSICEEAGKRNVHLLIEPVNRYETDYLTTLAHAARICSTVNHEYLGITADFFHMQIEELSISNSILSAGSWLRHIHVAENTRVEPGPGSLNFLPGFNALKKVDYNGFIEIESRSLSGPADIVFPRSIRYLNELWVKA